MKKKVIFIIYLILVLAIGLFVLTGCGNKKETKPKKRKTKQFINECLIQPYYDIKNLKVKYGTKNNMFWLFQTNGTIKDFNNEKKGVCRTPLVLLTN